MEPVSGPVSAPQPALDIIPDFLWLVLFCFTLYAMGAIFSLFHSRMIGQIIAGILFMGLGTKLLRGEELFTVAGWIGLGILVFEGGASLDMNLLRKVFIRASALAFLGSLLPVSFGIIYLHVILRGPLVEAVASGASLASTSIAVALILMQQHGIVETRIGTLLTSAAMLDDVFSLVLVAVVSSLGNIAKNNANSSVPTSAPVADPARDLAIAIVRPIAASIAVLGVGAIAARAFQVALQKLWSEEHFIDEIDLGSMATCRTRSRPCCPNAPNRTKCSRKCSCHSCLCSIKCLRIDKFIGRLWRRILISDYRDDAILCCMCLYAFAWSIASALSGSSYLIGAFVAGLAFASDPKSSTPTLGFQLSRVALAKIDPLKTFLLAIFFGSIGFSLRVSVLFEGWALLYGALIYTIIMIGAKLLTGFLAKPFSWAAFLTVGAAMVGRGELGLYLSEQAQRANIMSPRVFAVTTWALILNTFISPILFSIVARKYPSYLHAEDSSPLHP